MKDVLASLPEVQKKYSNFNLLLPTATDVQMDTFYKFHIEEVPVDTSEKSGDIFKVGSVQSGAASNGKPLYESVYSLSKPLLNKLAMAAGIQFDPKYTYGERVDRVTYRARALGRMKKIDGSYREETDQKVICLEDEEDKYRLEFSDKAVKGITDQKAAQAASELFAGKWIDTKDKYGKTCRAYQIDEKDRERYVERSVMTNMALLKKTWAEKAMTGAKLRVIRALLGVKGTYTKSELEKNFAVTTVTFAPDYSDPEIRKMMLLQAMSSVGNMFGSPNMPVKEVAFEDVYDVDSKDLSNPAYQSDLPDEDYADDYLTPDEAGQTIEPQQAEPNEPESRPEDFCCDKCGRVIQEKVWNWSVEKYGRPLCMKCQKEEPRL